MDGDRQSLAMPVFDDMDDFAPRRSAPAAPKVTMPKGQGASQPVVEAPAPRPVPSASETRRAVDAVSQFPSREASPDAQMNLKGPRHILDRFRKLCKDDRRAYYDMLEILMDSYEGKA